MKLRLIGVVLLALVSLSASAENLKVKVYSIPCAQLPANTWLVINTTGKLGEITFGKIGWTLNTDESPLVLPTPPSKQKRAIVLAAVRLEGYKTKKTIALHMGYCQEVKITTTSP